MSFSEQVDQAFSQNSGVNDILFPRDVIELALREKHHSVGTALSASFLDALTPEDQRLLEARVMGGIMTRIALGSEALKSVGDIGESFFDLSDTDQTDIRLELGETYVTRAERALEYTDGEVISLLEDSTAAELANPLRSIPHSFVRGHIAKTKRSEMTPSDRRKMILAYANVLPGSFPPDGFPNRAIGQNDSVLVQAFGRNSIPDKELPDVALMHGKSEDDNEVFEQLDIEGFDPGASNIALAKVIMRRILNGEKVIEPVIQWEVAYAIWKLDVGVYAKYCSYIHTVWPTSGFYPTYEVKADSIRTMDALGLYNPHELAHRDMMVRALGILAKQGVEADALFGTIPFDPNSVQAQVRGPMPWTIRETLTRGEHVLRGRVKL